MTRKITRLLLSIGCIGLLAACTRTAGPTPVPAPPTPSPTLRVPTATLHPPTETPAPLPITSLTELHMVDASTGWAWMSRPDMSSALLRTGDAGQTWTDVTPPGLPVVSFGGFFLDVYSAWVQAFDSTDNTNSLAATADGGRTWSVLNRSLPFANAGMTFASQQEGWAQTADVGAGQAFVQLYATQDGGATWTQIKLIDPGAAAPAPDGSLHLCGICGDSFYYDPVRMLVTRGDLASDPGGSARLAVSLNLGKAWKSLKLPLPAGPYAADLIVPHAPTFFGKNDALLPVQMTPNNATFSPTALAVYVTHDGGLTWKAASAVLENVSQFDLVEFVSLKNGFARCGTDLCATHDGAQTWQTLKSGLDFSTAATGEYVFNFDFVDASNGWAITTDGTTSALYRTTDGGSTWTKLAPVLAP